MDKEIIRNRNIFGDILLILAALCMVIAAYELYTQEYIRCYSEIYESHNYKDFNNNNISSYTHDLFFYEENNKYIEKICFKDINFMREWIENKKNNYTISDSSNLSLFNSSSSIS